LAAGVILAGFNRTRTVCRRLRAPRRTASGLEDSDRLWIGFGSLTSVSNRAGQAKESSCAVDEYDPA
jgi:hypothetical protein